MIRNLGQVAAIYIGSSAPRNTNLIWLDNTVVPFVFRAYDGSAWSELATHKWVRAYVDGWLVTLPPRQLADDGDYMLINSNNVNYKITVKDFVKSAVGNPLDFKGVIRVSADFPNPSTLEAGDMYVIITSPVGGTVTDPYSGKTFEDSEKIVWDEVTRSWESLGKINITVNLTTSYSETEVTIHSSAGKETTIQGVTDQLAGVMLPGQYSWLQALSNGSIVPGDPSPLTPLTPAHKHNYNDIINRLVSQQGTGESTIDPMSQKATTDALNLKFDKASVLQVSGAATDKVMSQKAVTDALKTLSDDFNNKLTNYLPLAGGTMKGNIRFPIGNGIACNDVAGTAAYVVLRTWNADNSTRMYVGTVNFPTYISSTASDLIHDRNGSSYLLWDSYNLPTPASTTDLNNYLPLVGGTLTGQLTIKQSVDIKLRLQSTDADNHCIIQAINSQASQLGVFGYAGDKWAIGHGGTYYEIWDKYNLTNPVTYTTNTYNHATLTNKDGQYFTYIKAGTNGLLPHSKATLTSGGSGSLGTSDQSFNAAYINNLHTNKVTFGDVGSFIDNQSGDSDHIGIGFYTSKNAACPVYVGSLCVSDGYANSAPNIPTNGIYSKGVIKSAAGFTSNFRQTNLNLAKTGNDVLYISSFTVDAAGSPGTDSNTGKSVNDGMFLTYFWVNDNAFQLAADIDGTGIAYRQYIPSSGNSTTGWKFLADTNWVVSKINSSTSNFLKKTGDTATGQIIFDSYGLAFNNITWSNDLVPNRSYGGYLQVLDAYNKSSAGGPTDYGTVLQINSRNAHWANQLWFSGGAEASKNGLYYRHMAYNQTEYGEWNRLLTNKDVNIIQTQSSSNPSTLPVNQIFYSEIKGVAGTPTTNGSLFSVQGDDEGIQLWASSSRTELYYRTKWTSFGNWIKLATTSDIGNYLPLTGGTLSGNLAINTVGSTTLVINNNDINGSETFIRVLRKGTASAAIGFRDSLGAYIYNYNSNKYLFIDNDGYARVGTTSSSTRLALITDISIVSGYLPLSGGTMTGALTMNNRKNNAVIDVVGGTGNNWNGGAGALSVQVPSDGGQTPLLLARRSGATINTTTLSERLLDMALLDTGTIFKVGMSGVNALELEVTSFTNKVGIGKLFGKQIATTDQIPSIPSISISNSGSGNAVTSITASGHTLTVTKGATYLTSSSLDGYATQTWANGQFAPLSRFNTSTGYTTIKVTGQEFNFDSANPEIYMNYRTLSGSTAVTKITWKAGGGANSTALCEGRWGNLYMNNNLVATQSWAAEKFPNKTGAGASGTWGISISGNATTATTASKLGSTTIGGSAKPIYLSSGTPTACSATVGSATVPVYMNAGTITQCSTTLGVSITGNAATATNATQLGGTAASSYVKANDNISRLTNDSGYTTQEWVNSQNFVKSTSTKKVTDIQPVDALPATQASGVLYLVFG